MANFNLSTYALDSSYCFSPSPWPHNHPRRPGITKYEKPPMHLEGSILNLSNTGGAGRGSDKGNIVGDVINHGKRKYWKRGDNYHYHCTLKAGENTLEAQLTRQLLQHLTAGAGQREFDKEGWLQRFVTFMTTPGSHNDTYASTYIRQFFANREAGKPLADCADNDGHNTDAIDAMTGLAPFAVLAAGRGEPSGTNVERFLSTTRNSRRLPQYARLFTDMVQSLLERPEDEAPADALRRVTHKAAAELGLDLDGGVARHERGDPMVACYIDSSFPALLIFAAKYAKAGPKAALLASANAGGENVARGAALGALMGAAYGSDAWKGDAWLVEGLKGREGIEAEMNAFLQAAGYV